MVFLRFVIFEKGDKQSKLGQVFLRFVSILFLLFEKGGKQKNCASSFRIYKYTFLIFEKGISKKLRQVYLEFASIPF